MASRKFYAYYVRGSQLALIEYDANTGDGLNYVGTDKAVGTSLDDIGPGGGLLWGSPTEAITDGIEIEYAYSPRYSINDEIQPGVNQFGYNAWTVVDGYLTLLASSVDWTASPYTAVAANDYIKVVGSSRWNGLHKVQEVQASLGTVHGGVKTYTKVNQSVKSFTDSSATWYNTESLTNLISGAFEVTFIDATTTPYLWLAGSDAVAGNNGLYSGWLIQSDTQVNLQPATGGEKYTINNYITEAVGSFGWTTDATQAMYIYEAFRDSGAYFISDINALDDESDSIDLPEYLAKALVYYVKAKIAEDVGEIDQREYNMREFRRILERHESSKIWGARMVGPGPSAIR